MGRHRSSDSDSDYSRSSRTNSKKSKRRKKERRRGRSRSSSLSDSSRYSSSRHSKKSRKKHGKRSSPSPDRRGYSERSRRSRSRSRSHERYGSRNKRRSRSRSYERKTSRRSRSPDTSRRRSRSPSFSRDGRSRSGSQGRGSRGQRRSRSRSRSNDKARSSREASHSSVSQSHTPLHSLSADDQRESHKPLTMAEQAEERMRQALKAAAAADEKLRMEALRNDQKAASPDLCNSQKFTTSVAAIESNSFVPSSFKSSRASTKTKDDFSDSRSSHDDAIFGSLSVTGFTLKPDPDNRPIDLEADSIVHPSLFCDPEEKMDRWIERLSQLRKRKLEGEAMQ